MKSELFELLQFLIYKQSGTFEPVNRYALMLGLNKQYVEIRSSGLIINRSGAQAYKKELDND